MNNEEFGKLFDYLCVNSEKSDTEIANNIGVDKATIGRWRKGERTPKLSFLPSIAKYFNVDMNIFRISNVEEYISQSKKNNNLMTPSNITSLEEATQVFIDNPQVAAYGGYDLEHMSDDEKIEFANQIADSIKFFAKRYKK